MDRFADSLVFLYACFARHHYDKVISTIFVVFPWDRDLIRMRNATAVSPHRRSAKGNSWMISTRDRRSVSVPHPRPFILMPTKATAASRQSVDKG